jgi:regulation of enolase protein 1 (concanavalin A-like superfamily)
MKTIKLGILSEELTWQNPPQSTEKKADDGLSITAGKETDWFFDPAGKSRKKNAPVALFSPQDENFILSSKVSVEFASNFDAGVLFVYEDVDHWAKLCFEYAPTKQPMIVSVVTRGQSDDSNSVYLERNSVYLRIYREGDTLAFHFSEDGKYWHLVRHFTIGKLQNLQVGFSTQSPTGEGCRAHFEEISYRRGKIADLRNGD